MGVIPRNEFQITFGAYDSSGIHADNIQSVGDILLSDRTPGIDLNDWLANATPHGLPNSRVGSGTMYYWHPRDGSVARFIADSLGAVLCCDWGPRVHDAELGVRQAFAKK